MADSCFLVRVRGLGLPYVNGGRKTKPGPKEGPVLRGRRTRRMCSFRGTYTNRGNGTEQSSSDVVRVRGLEPRRFRTRT